MLLLAALSAGALATVASAAPAAPGRKAEIAPGGYFKAGFDLLAAFPFDPPEPDPAAKPGTPPPSAAKQIPPEIKALDGRKVIVSGFMIPTKMEKGLVTELLLVASQQLCCYGAVPKLNEFIVVKMLSGGVKATSDVPVEFHGKISVKEVFEDGYLSHIYAVDAEKLGKVGTD